MQVTTDKAEEEMGGQYDVNYKYRLQGKRTDKNGSGSCPMTSSYIKSIESLGTAARSLINFIREVRQFQYHLL